MNLEIWFAFALASAALLAIPGPTVMLVVGYGLRGGKQTGWVTVPAVALGDFTAMTVSLLGAGALLATSATLFTALKWLGACYLVWLGIQLWRQQPKPPQLGLPKRNDDAAMFRNAFVVTALNPKGIVFFVAFLPQFVDSGRAILPQFILLEATFLSLAVINIILWVFVAGEMRARISQPKTLRWLNRVGASFLIGAGLLTAMGERNG